jgi:formylglycine-generating enzyme required for sulfatase activity
MNILRLIILVLVTFFIILFFDSPLNAQKRSNNVHTTGWNKTFSDSTPEFKIIQLKPNDKRIPDEMSLIYGGKFDGKVMFNGNLNHIDDSTAWVNALIEKGTIKSFFLKKTEVTNKEYREFVYWVRDSIARELLSNIDALSVHPSNNYLYKYSKGIVQVYPDTLCWVKDFPILSHDPFWEQYFHDTQFDNYPVVGITYEQALAFCYWKNFHQKSKKGILNLFYRLPSQQELTWAMHRNNMGQGHEITSKQKKAKQEKA